MELVVLLALLGIVAGALTGLVGWAFRQQAVLEQQESQREAVHQGLARVADLIRRAGAATRPAIQAGTPDAIYLRGFSGPAAWTGNVVVQVSLDQTGRLVAAAQNRSASPVDLVPGARFQELRLRYAVAGASSDGNFKESCDSGTTSVACSQVSAVEVTLRALLSQEEESLWVALRNPGGG